MRSARRTMARSSPAAARRANLIAISPPRRPGPRVAEVGDPRTPQHGLQPRRHELPAPRRRRGVDDVRLRRAELLHDALRQRRHDPPGLPIRDRQRGVDQIAQRRERPQRRALLLRRRSREPSGGPRRRWPRRSGRGAGSDRAMLWIRSHGRIAPARDHPHTGRHTLQQRAIDRRARQVRGRIARQHGDLPAARVQLADDAQRPHRPDSAVRRKVVRHHQRPRRGTRSAAVMTLPPAAAPAA